MLEQAPGRTCGLVWRGPHGVEGVLAGLVTLDYTAIFSHTAGIYDVLAKEVQFPSDNKDRISLTPNICNIQISDRVFQVTLDISPLLQCISSFPQLCVFSKLIEEASNVFIEAINKAAECPHGDGELKIVFPTFARDIRINSNNQSQVRGNEHYYKLAVMLVKPRLDGNMPLEMEKTMSVNIGPSYYAEGKLLKKDL
ncbi:hypothetical protein BTVI_84822 [Pitangus sulphuratus]|nr:hypothetical protein BTVI_84822 [Pitangus sulphuratus]